MAKGLTQEGKKQRLADHVAPLAARGCTFPEILNLIHTAYLVLRPDSGLIWSEVEQIIEEATEETP